MSREKICFSLDALGGLAGTGTCYLGLTNSPAQT